MVVDLLALFCEWAEKHVAPRTYGWYRAYLYRFVRFVPNDALEQGLNPITVAELLGRTDASTLSRVYQHLADRHGHMSQAVARATSGNA